MLLDKNNPSSCPKGELNEALKRKLAFITLQQRAKLGEEKSAKLSVPDKQVIKQHGSSDK